MTTPRTHSFLPCSTIILCARRIEHFFPFRCRSCVFKKQLVAFLVVDGTVNEEGCNIYSSPASARKEQICEPSWML